MAEHCSAYDQPTHEEITQQAEYLLQNQYPGQYAEFTVGYSSAVIQGSSDEDNPSVRGATHFYDPETDLGLHLRAGGINMEGTVPLFTFAI